MQHLSLQEMYNVSSYYLGFYIYYNITHANIYAYFIYRFINLILDIILIFLEFPLGYSRFS